MLTNPNYNNDNNNDVEHTATVHELYFYNTHNYMKS